MNKPRHAAFTKHSMMLTDQDRAVIARLRARVPTTAGGRAIWWSDEGRWLLEQLVLLRRLGVSTKHLADAAGMTRNNLYAVMAYPRVDKTTEITLDGWPSNQLGSGRTPADDIANPRNVTLDLIAAKVRLFASANPNLVVELRISYG